jgi:hypothetical protein
MGLFKKRESVDLTDPDFENSKAAIEETAELFSQVMRRLNPNWGLYGKSELTHWIKKKKYGSLSRNLQSHCLCQLPLLVAQANHRAKIQMNSR